MYYTDLNKKQKERMKQISAHSYIMEWENPEFMDYLMGELPRLRHSQKDNDAADEISKLEKMISTYDPFQTDMTGFLDEIEHVIRVIQEKIKIGLA